MAEAAPLPIACSLEAREASERAEAWRGLAERALLTRERSQSQARLVFRSRPDIEVALRELAAAEEVCCPFLDLELTRAGDRLTLAVSGPPEAGAILDMFAGHA
jgi:MerR family copper efflux transcriptional regulator